MKKYKNILLSLISFVIAYLLLYSFHLSGSGYLFVFYIFILIALWLGYVSIRQKESSWAGFVILIIGLLSLLYPVTDLDIVPPLLFDIIFRK